MIALLTMAQAADLREGAGGTIEVVDGAVARDYNRAGRLVAVVPSDHGVPEVNVEDGVIEVPGRAPCRIHVEAREGTVQGLALRGSYAALRSDKDLLLVDLDRCVPVAARSDARVSSAAFIGDELVTLGQPGRGYAVQRWSLPDLALRGSFTTGIDAILVGSDGPVLFTEGALNRGRTVASRLAWADHELTLPPRTILSRGTVLALADDGSLAQYDSAGRKLAETGPGALYDLQRVDTAPGEWWVADQQSVVHLPGGERRDRGPVHGVDDPERADALATTPPWVAPDPVLLDAAPWVVRRRAAGLVVTSGGKQLGATIPIAETPVSVTPDGAVLLTVGDRGLSAWAVADARPLWTAAGEKGRLAAAGGDWVAAGDERGWRFYDPLDGHLVAVLEPQGSLLRDGAVLPFGPRAVRGHAWGAPRPTSTPMQPPSLAIGSPLDPLEPSCVDPARALEPLRSWPTIYNAEREKLARRCVVRTDDAPPVWPPTSAPAAGASWAWKAPGRVLGLSALDGGFLLVRVDKSIGVLGPDGTLRWTAAGEGFGAGGLVLDAATGRVTARDVATGRIVWARSGLLTNVDGEVRLQLARGGPTSRLDPLTNELHPLPEDTDGAAAGWVCEAGTCRMSEVRWAPRFVLDGGVEVVDLDRVILLQRAGAEVARLNGYTRPTWQDTGSFLARSTADNEWVRIDTAGKVVERLGAADMVAVDGPRRWRLEGGVVTAFGLDAPGTAATPVVFDSAPIVAAPVIPPPLPIPASRAGDWVGAGVEEDQLVYGLDGAVLLRDGKPLWSAAGTTRVGIVGDVAIVRIPGGAHQGRDLETGKLLWSAELGSGDLSTAVGGLLRIRRGERGAAQGASYTELLDERTGKLLGSWEARVLRVARRDEHVYVALESGSKSAIREVGGGEIGVIDGGVRELAAAGDVVVALGERRLVAWRGGKVAWTVADSAPFWHIVGSGDRINVNVGGIGYSTDAKTGRVLEVVRVGE